MVDAYRKFMEGWKDKHIAVIGDIILDHYIIGNSTRLSPEAPVPVVNLEVEEYRLGGAANVANNIHKLGGRCTLFGYYCEKTNELLPKEIGRKFFKETNVPVKSRIICNGQQIARIDNENIAHLSSMAIHELCLSLLNKIETENIECVVIQDYGKGFINSDLLVKLAKLCKEENIPIVMDPCSKLFHNYEIFRNEEYKDSSIFILKPNYKELCEITGLTYSGDKYDMFGLASIMEHVCDNHNIQNMLVTMSKLGMVYYDSKSNSHIHVPAIKTEVLDVTGAGDTVVSVIALGILSSSFSAMIDVMVIATHAAKTVISKLGTSSTTIEEILESIENERK